MKLTIRVLLWTVCLAALLATGCSDEASPGGISPPPADAGDVRDAPFLPDGGNHQLIAIQPAPGESLWLAPHSSAEIKVKYVTAGGSPIPGTVEFTLIEDGVELSAGGSRLQSGQGQTDDDGIATVIVDSGEQAAHFQVRCSAAYADDLSIDVLVNPKGVGSLEVTLIYGQEGRWNVAEAFVYLYEHSEDRELVCGEDILERDISRNPMAARTSAPIQDLSRTAMFTELPSGTSYTILAFARQERGPDKPVVAHACLSAPEQTTILDGPTRQVIMYLEDFPPAFSGTFDVTSFYDFIAMLPDDIEDVVRQIGGFFQSPGRQIIVWLEPLIQDVIGGGVPEGIRDFLGQLIDDAIAEFAPAWVNDTFLIGEDVFNILSQLEVRSVLELTEEPALEGSGTRLRFAEEATREHWTGVAFDWRQGSCEGVGDEGQCGHREFRWDQMQINPVSAAGFGVYVDNYFDMTVEPHELIVNYGQLLLFIVEKLILPQTFGNDIQSFEDLLFDVLGEDNEEGESCLASGGPTKCCTDFGRRASDWAGMNIENTVRVLCEQGVPMASIAMREWVSGLFITSEGVLTIGTQEPCLLHDTNDDLEVDRLGKEGENERCNWEGNLSIGGLPIEPFVAPFYGKRTGSGQ